MLCWSELAAVSRSDRSGYDAVLLLDYLLKKKKVVKMSRGRRIWMMKEEEEVGARTSTMSRSS